MATENATPAPTEPAAPSFDMGAAMESIEQSLDLQPDDPPAEGGPADEQQQPEEKAPAEGAGKPPTESEEPVPAGVLQEGDQSDAPPDSWRKEAKAAWKDAPPLLKEEVRKREADTIAYVERTKQPAAIGEHLTKIIQPYLPMLEKQGVDPWQNIGAMLKVQEVLSYGSPEQKQAMVKTMAQMAGLQLEGGQLSTAEGQQAQYIQRLEQRLAALEGGVTKVTSVVQEQREAELTEAIRGFAEDAAHPHFEAVASRIAGLIQTGAARSLKEAYDLAILQDPLIRAKVIDEEAAKRAQTTAAEAQKRADAARKTASVNVRTTSRQRVAQPLGSIDDTLKDTLKEIQSR